MLLFRSQLAERYFFVLAAHTAPSFLGSYLQKHLYLAGYLISPTFAAHWQRNEKNYRL